MFDKLLAWTAPSGTNTIVMINVEHIVSNPDQPRRVFEQESLMELARSIQAYGMLQPITVRRIETGRYELIAGERRLLAAILADMRRVPCIVMDIQREDSALISIVENIQRKDLSFFEEAQAIANLIHRFGLTQEQVARKLGKTQSTIANKLRVLRLPDDVRDIISESGLSERHARALLKLPAQMWRDAAILMAKEQMPVAKAEAYIDSILKNPQPVQKPRSQPIGIFKDLRIFTNTINHALTVMRDAGVDALSVKTEDERYIMYEIKIPKPSA